MDRDSHVQTAVASGQAPWKPLPAPDFARAADIPLGAWVEAGLPDNHGRPVLQLREIPLEQLEAPELDSEGRVEPAKRRYVQEYADRWAAGEEPPPVRVLETYAGGLRLVDGHRRLLAARRLGRTSLVAWVSPLVPVPDDTGDVELLTMTAELAERHARPVAQTQTPEFLRWFGDSKVVDADGEPLVVYHGTARRFATFDLTRSGQNFAAGKGAIFFTPEVAFADQMANFLAEDDPAGEPVVMAVYLTLKKPLVRDFNGDDIDVAALIEEAKAHGHDGVIAKNAQDAMPAWAETQYIAFSADQIKSATGNRGTFDPADPRITFSRADARDAAEAVISGVPRKRADDGDHPAARSRAEMKATWFRQWFEGSRIVDALGQPRVVYHGTSRPFEVFDPAQTGGGGLHGSMGALFFAGSRAEAWTYAKRTQQRAGGRARVVEAFLVLRNPAVMSLDALYEIGRQGRGAEARAELEAQGFDGIVAESHIAEGNSEFVAFRAEQVHIVGSSLAPAGAPNQGDTPPIDLSDAHEQGRKPFFRDLRIGQTTLCLQFHAEAAQETPRVAIVSLRTPRAKRGQGSARAALSALIQAADAQGVKLTLDAAPLDRSTKVGRLVAFYASLGFVPTGRSNNYVGDPEMERLPALREQGQTESAAFRTWFANSAVVDENGQPRVVYHGSVRWQKGDTEFGDVTAFDRLFTRKALGRQKSVDQVGSWFSDAPGDKGAGMYAGSPSERTGSVIYPVYLSIQNPWRPREGFKTMRRIAARLSGVDPDSIRGPLDAEPLRQWIIGLGYDGIEFPRGSVDGTDQQVFVAFHPEQIKSAIGNVGAFGQRRVLDVEAERLGMSSDEAAIAQAAGDIRFSRAAGEFYSPLLRSLEDGRGAPKRTDAAGWRAWLDGAQRRGEFRKSERDWLSVDRWLGEQPGEIPRAVLIDFVRANEVRVQEVVLEADATPVIEEVLDLFAVRGYRIGVFNEGNPDQEIVFEDPEGNEVELYELPQELADAYNATALARKAEPRHGKHRAIAGGENYRELLLTLPSNSLTDAELESFYAHTPDAGRPPFWMLNDAQRAAVARQAARERGEYRSSHWDQPNVLAHVRMDEHTDADGNRVLLIHELQSDWHQNGRKNGYGASPSKAVPLPDGGWTVEFSNGTRMGEYPSREAAEAGALRFPNRGVPDAPFKNTSEWVLLAMKHVVRWAATQGIDTVAWATGEQVAEMFDLSKQVQAIYYVANEDGTFDIEAYRLTVRVMDETGVSLDRVSALVGKDLAERIARGEGALARGDVREGTREFRGDDLKIGGAGMRTFYDTIVPAAVAKWAKPFGARVGSLSLSEPEGTGEASSVPGTEVHALQITAELRAAARAGFPLFARSEGGEQIQNSGAMRDGEQAEGVAEAPWKSTGVSMRSGDAKDESRGAQQDIRSHADAVRRRTEMLTAGWPVDVRVVDTPWHLPPAVRAHRDFDPARVDAVQAFGQVLIVASRVRSDEHLQTLLAHEVVGHVGVERILGPERFERVVAQIDSARAFGHHAELFAEVERRYEGADRRTQACEAIAVFAERGVRVSWISEVIAAVRGFLRDTLKLPLAFGATDLEGLVSRAARAVRAAPVVSAATAPQGQHAYSRAETQPLWRSALAEAVERAEGAPKRADAALWRAWLDGAERRGEFRKSERDWVGVDAWLTEEASRWAVVDSEGREVARRVDRGLALATAKRRTAGGEKHDIRPVGITREALQAFVRANVVELTETLLDSRPPTITWGAWSNPEDDPAGDAFIDSADGRWRLVRDAQGWIDVYERTPDGGFECLDGIGALDGEARGHAVCEELAAAVEELAVKGRAERAPHFQKFALTGGQNYRELLLQLPAEPAPAIPQWEQTSDDMLTAELPSGRLAVIVYDSEARENGATLSTTDQDGEGGTSEIQFDSVEQAKAAAAGLVRTLGEDRPGFRSDHWKHPNVLVHVRFDERSGGDGKRSLFLIEIQSDWHQRGRKTGYAGEPLSEAQQARHDALAARRDHLTTREHAELVALSFKRNSAEVGVPQAPFRQTDAWAMLAFKRAVRFAVDHGFDQVAWISGSAAAGLMQIAQHVDQLWYRHRPDGRVDLGGAKGGQYRTVAKAVAPTELERYVGKDLALRVIAGVGREACPFPNGGALMRVIEGEDLRIGGEGMTAFYDQILPAAVKRWARPFGAAITRVELEHTEGEHWAVDITPAMRAAVAGGQPMFYRAPPANALATWFGDSKVVNPDGSPKVVYHGTGGDVEAFLRMPWASESPELACDYATMRGELHGGAPNVMPLYMRIERPFDADRDLPATVTVRAVVGAIVSQAQAKGRSLAPEAIEAIEVRQSVLLQARIREESGPYYSRHDFWHETRDFFGEDGAQALREIFEIAGFDGITTRECGVQTWGAFSPDQVKSATGNCGAFDPADARIAFARAELEDADEHAMPRRGAGMGMSA